MQLTQRKRRFSGWWAVFMSGILVFIGITLLIGNPAWIAAASSSPDEPASTTSDTYIVLAWSERGMHFYKDDFEYFAFLPPYNTLRAQVIRMGNPPELVTQGITVTYHFPDNTYSVGKTNFWDYEQDLFAVDLHPNVGLTGKGLTGTLDIAGTTFVAEGIPLTEFSDDAYAANSTNPESDPYQLATVTVWDAATGVKLAETVSVAPVSTEMACVECHYDGKFQVSTGNVDLNILTLHDKRHEDDYATPGDALAERTPVLCAECHPSDALPGLDGKVGLPDLANAIHKNHAPEMPSTMSACYQCHPGAETEAFRGAMVQDGTECADCHGTLFDLEAKSSPWLDEPRCSTSECHNTGEYSQDQALYGHSVGHGDIYCAGCHDSAHAIAPSREANDGLKFLALQGVNASLGGVDHCDLCHTALPPADGPHGLMLPDTWQFSFEPDHVTNQSLGATVLYTHTLKNTGNVSDTYALTWISSQGWGDVRLRLPASNTSFPVTLNMPVRLQAGDSVQVEVAVSVPTTETVRGLTDTTIVTAASLSDASLVDTVVDTTRTAILVYLPLVVRQ